MNGNSVSFQRIWENWKIGLFGLRADIRVNKTIDIPELIGFEFIGFEKWDNLINLKKYCRGVYYYNNAIVFLTDRGIIFIAELYDWDKELFKIYKTDDFLFV